jgi:threonine dehydrogenase-like Zn-dependent dehydrogenase
MLRSSVRGTRIPCAGAWNRCDPMGRYTQVAICGREIQVPIDQILYKQLTVRGSITYTARTWERMMRIYAQGAVRLHDLISSLTTGIGR